MHVVNGMETKTRLTITLAKEILSKIDSIIDKKLIKNRSHAIEVLVSKALSPKTTSAIILGGGSKHKTSPLLTLINGRSLLSLVLEHMKKFGVNKVIVCAGKFENKVKKTFSDGSNFGIKVVYLKENKPLGTAGIVKKAFSLLDSDRFLVLHGDVLTNINLNDFEEFHQGEESIATIAVKPRVAHESLGKVLLQGNHITEFIEEGDRGLGIVNTGIYVFDKEIADYIPKKTPSTLEKDVFPRLAKEGKLTGFIFQGVWFDISRQKDFKEALVRWKKEERR